MGEIYDNFGPNHYSVEDMRQRLPGMWEPVWLHDLEAEVNEAIEALGKQQDKNFKEADTYVQAQAVEL